MKILDTQTGDIQEYGADGHDSLRVSQDGRTLSYYNLQNGDGSAYGDYRFVCDDNKVPAESETADARHANVFFNIGGWHKRPQGDLISREALKEAIKNLYNETRDGIVKFGIEKAYKEIDNAPTVEVPENTVNCVLTEFGNCSYNKTGCSDCEIKNKIRKALNERPQGEWIDEGLYADYHSEHAYRCKRCGWHIIESPDLIFENRFCKHCGAEMKGGKK